MKTSFGRQQIFRRYLDVALGVSVFVDPGTHRNAVIVQENTFDQDSYPLFLAQSILGRYPPSDVWKILQIRQVYARHQQLGRNLQARKMVIHAKVEGDDIEVLGLFAHLIRSREGFNNEYHVPSLIAQAMGKGRL